jgi:opacity protein-like surface antigen
MANAALRFLDGTSPIATIGGGLTFSAGSLVTDVGYRYRRIFSDSWVNALSTGTGLDMNEVRIGVGVRF